MGLEASSENPPVTLECVFELFVVAAVFLILCRERRIYHVYWKLNRTIPGLQERILDADEAELEYIASLVCPVFLALCRRD
jgi:hypothetical protein